MIPIWLAVIVVAVVWLCIPVLATILFCWVCESFRDPHDLLAEPQQDAHSASGDLSTPRGCDHEHSALPRRGVSSEHLGHRSFREPWIVESYSSPAHRTRRGAA